MEVQPDPGPGPSTHQPPAHLSLLDTIADGKAWLRQRLREGGRCPVCHGHVQAYRRKITGPMVKAMVAVYQASSHDFVHMPTVVGAGRADEAKLVHWGLIEEEKTLRHDGGRAGYWRITELGRDFLHGKADVQKYAIIYNARCLSHEGPMVSAQDCVGEAFRLDELLGGG